MSSKYKDHLIVKKIGSTLHKLDVFDIVWESDFFVASLKKKYLDNIHTGNIKIALHFNFDLDDEEYSEHMEIAHIESCIKGVGSDLVALVMDCVPEDIKVCVVDATVGEAIKFWPKMAKKYPNLVIYYSEENS